MLMQASCAAIGGRGVMVLGPSGIGKSSLLLALIDRGACLIGDDGVELASRTDRILISPAPATVGVLEIRNLGLLTFPAVADIPLALVITLSSDAPRYIDTAEKIVLLGIDVPHVQLWPDGAVLALKTEAALMRYGQS